MKTIKINSLRSLIAQGRVECVTDIKIGLVEIRWLRTGKTEHVTVS